MDLKPETQVFINSVEQVEDYTEYTIEVHHNGFMWKIKHRYSEFRKLHNALRNHNPDLEKNLLPPKKIIGKMSTSFIDKRREELELYLQTLMSQKFSGGVPRTLGVFLDFHHYEVERLTQDLAKELFAIGDSVLAHGKMYVFTPLQLWAISQRLTAEKPKSDAENPEYDFGHVLDFVQKLRHLHIQCQRGFIKQSNIVAQELSFDLSLFRSLEQLTMDRCGPEQVRVVSCLRRTLNTLSIHHSLTTIQSVLIEEAHENLPTSEVDPASIWSKLVTADFSENEISEIDISVRLLVMVDFLDLSKNKISKIENLQYLSQLVFLDLSNNEIAEIELAHAKLGNVKTLNLSCNKLKSLEGLGKMYSLEVLDLSKNQINEIRSVDHVSKLPCLTKLSLQSNPISEEVDYRTKTLSRFGTRAGEILLDGVTSSQKELDTSFVLSAILQSRRASEGRQIHTDRGTSPGSGSPISKILVPRRVSRHQVLSAGVMSAPDRLSTFSATMTSSRDFLQETHSSSSNAEEKAEDSDSSDNTHINFSAKPELDNVTTTPLATETINSPQAIPEISDPSPDLSEIAPPSKAPLAKEEEMSDLGTPTVDLISESETLFPSLPDDTLHPVPMAEASSLVQELKTDPVCIKASDNINLLLDQEPIHPDSVIPTNVDTSNTQVNAPTTTMVDETQTMRDTNTFKTENARTNTNISNSVTTQTPPFPEPSNPITPPNSPFKPISTTSPMSRKSPIRISPSHTRSRSTGTFPPLSPALTPTLTPLKPIVPFEDPASLMNKAIQNRENPARNLISRLSDPSLAQNTATVSPYSRRTSSGRQHHRRFTTAPLLNMKLSSPAMLHLSHQPKSALLRYFRSSVMLEDEELLHITWCNTITQEDSDSNPTSCVFISSKAFYIVYDDRENPLEPDHQRSLNFKAFQAEKSLSYLKKDTFSLTNGLKQVSLGLSNLSLEIKDLSSGNFIKLLTRSTSINDLLIRGLLAAYGVDERSFLAAKSEGRDFEYQPGKVRFVFTNERTVSQLENSFAEYLGPYREQCTSMVFYTSAWLRTPAGIDPLFPGGEQSKYLDVLAPVSSSSAVQSNRISLDSNTMTDHMSPQTDVLSPNIPPKIAIGLAITAEYCFLFTETPSYRIIDAISPHDVAGIEVCDVSGYDVTISSCMTSWSLEFRDYAEREKTIEQLCKQYAMTIGGDLCIKITEATEK
uniref:nischarin isoform X2 n=1 Tax=Ciona intestinalis TaxID=7719 RepID=UPI000EF4B71C|nr:nischarin isoform X2 [Ciona intestinalis]|eukprot:XP_026693582.1 nischarin isoform X2 [Ciona intestinalis]